MPSQARSRRLPTLPLSVAALAGAVAAAIVGCASEPARTTFEPAAPAPSESAPPPLPSASAPCTGLRCAVPSCAEGKTTALEGTVYDPAGKVPLYNALVYVPNAELAPMAAGATCERCGAVSGEPIATALTDAKGHFRLEGVPAGAKVPLVVQVGKWRRRIELATVAACETTAIKDGLVQLPRSRAEGDIPQIALVTGGFDELGCLLSRIGLEKSEYTDPTGAGAVHVYKGVGGGALDKGTTPTAPDLWKDEASLARYDMVLLSCEGWEYDEDDGTNGNKTKAQKAAMKAYAEHGGRVFATHYGYTWFKESPDESFRSVATWNAPASAYGSKTYSVDTTFPKGAAFADWLEANGATTAPGTPSILVTNPAANVAAVDPQRAQRWLYTKDASSSVGYFSFNVPVGAPADQQCGRAVFSDLHVSGEHGGSPLPSSCGREALTPQELALEFMLFDLASCVMPDGSLPAPPAPK